MDMEIPSEGTSAYGAYGSNDNGAIELGNRMHFTYKNYLAWALQ